MTEDIEQLLIFTLGEDVFGIDILRVKEIRAVGKIRAIPNMPDDLLGVLDYREHIVPVLDMRVKLGFKDNEIKAQTVMIIVNVKHTEQDYSVGMVVDSVSDVISLDKDSLQPAPKINMHNQSNLLKGMFTHEDNVLVVLDLDNILDEQDLTGVQGLLAGNQ